MPLEYTLNSSQEVIELLEREKPLPASLVVNQMENGCYKVQMDGTTAYTYEDLLRREVEEKEAYQSILKNIHRIAGNMMHDRLRYDDIEDDDLTRIYALTEEE